MAAYTLDELVQHTQRPNSRLACQIVVDEACDGIIVQIPS